jgi:glyoxylase-like metal-dependent hydrolase (beta-lactamase superfamily II)
MLPIALLLNAVATALAAPAPAVALRATAVAPGVYAVIGADAEISPANRGRIGNSGFIVGPRGVAVVDTGVSRREGSALLQAITAVTPKPIRLAIITHAAREFVLGGAAFKAQGIPILAQRETAKLIARRCEGCLEYLRGTLGDDEMEGSAPVLPQRTIRTSTSLEVGGRRLQLLYFGPASTPGDLAVWDRQSGVLFAGALVSANRVPELRDADLRGWIAALDRIDMLPIQRIVPGYGPVVTHAAVSETRDYLVQLDATVRALYRSGASLTDAIARADLPTFASWKLYALNHPQNVQHLYLQLEDEDFGAKP